MGEVFFLAVVGGDDAHAVDIFGEVGGDAGEVFADDAVLDADAAAEEAVHDVEERAQPKDGQGDAPVGIKEHDRRRRTSSSC